MNRALQKEVEWDMAHDIEPELHIRNLTDAEQLELPKSETQILVDALKNKGKELEEGEQLKIKGLEKSTNKNKADLFRAQLVAEYLGLGGALVTSDDVRDEFLKHYGRELKIGNAIGNLFRDPGSRPTKPSEKWKYAGRTKSTRKEGHARYISCWKLRVTE